MQDKNIISKTLIPHVGHTNLLYIASAVWFFAGGMLLYRGFSEVLIHSEFLLPKVIVALFLGLVFYNLMFKKISKKHIMISQIEQSQRTCLLHKIWQGFHPSSQRFLIA